jgi:hypothetical protein
VEPCSNAKISEQSPEKREQMEKQRLEQERKMELIDAMNGFPNALKVRLHLFHNPLCPESKSPKTAGPFFIA